jgi:hypothetical protein
VLAPAPGKEPVIGIIYANGPRDGRHETWWLRPVPLTGDLTFECDWLDADAHGQPVVISSTELQAARERAVDL